ncbi:sensory histidine kinase CreC [Streptomyces sp. YIM 121038]|uniref:ATP-binding protein n=1 Tax=Streptomyces sp. YIM 121038 TaxID=2136401 RepID=UPI00111036F5|nr:ATP-binding protein [Streptomyces sp. YIM 121038]QCX73941.1 sensory histidine kinase CreC [Streptomyces sp. YIM 121038]
MTLSADGRPSGIAGTPRTASSLPLLLLGAAAVAGAVAAGLAPSAARGWVAAVAVVGWLLLAVVVWTGRAGAARLRAHAAQLESQLTGAQTQLGARGAEVIHMAQVTLPTVARSLRDGAGPQDALHQTRPPAEPAYRELLNVCVTLLADAEGRAAGAAAAQHHTAGDLTRVTDDVRLLATETLPAVVGALRGGASADRVLANVTWPADPTLRDLTEAAVRELALSERRAAAAQTASAKALSRVQAKSVSMLADLREMQDRHGEDVFGDLLRLDHSTSQLGLMTDRLALLMGGRSSRAWNKPIVMESILRGAVGRIAAYQRVRLHSSTKAAVVGFAAEGVMHLLAELMDNAANFSPPTDEVHVYVEESRTGVVVTIEDSGLRMSEAALRRAKESVSGQAADLALLQGTRLGLAVVGRLAVKYGVSVNFRPSSRGGTGVVILLPPQLLAQQPQPDSARTVAAPSAEAPSIEASVTEAPALPAPGQAVGPEATEAGPSASLPSAPASAGPVSPVLPEQGPADGPEAPGAPQATPGGLPVRRPGRTMAAAHAATERRTAERHPDNRHSSERQDAQQTGPDAERTGASSASPDERHRSGQSIGDRFGAFHRARRAAADDTAENPQPPRAE